MVTTPATSTYRHEKWIGSMTKHFTPPKLKPSQLLAIRGRWHRWAATMRVEVAALTLTERSALERLADGLSVIPRVSYYGGPTQDWPPHEAYRLAARYQIANVEYFNPWFITEDGWRSYEMAFFNLPVPEKLSTGGGQTAKVIHSFPQDGTVLVSKYKNR